MKRAQSYLGKMPKKKRDSIVEKMEKIAQMDTVGLNILKLTNREGFRLRVGGYRVIYKIEHDELLVMVLDVDSRGGIYK